MGGGISFSPALFTQVQLKREGGKERERESRRMVFRCDLVGGPATKRASDSVVLLLWRAARLHT